MRRFPLVVVAACLLALTACSTPPAPEPTVTTLPGPTITPTLTPTPTPTPTVNAALAPFMSQKLKWKKCEGDLECTTLLVPLDYAAPEYSTLNIAVIRRTARDTKKHKNAIVVNPGGPGGSGFDYVANSSTIVGSSVSKTFDVVGFDPRGVGRSSPIKCLTPAQSDRFYASDGSPDSDAEATAVFLIGKEFAKVCEYADPTILGFLGTRESAQDMDILRTALGQKQLNYVGKSYGTSLGTQYAKQFPTKVGRFVLDGAIDPSLDADAFAAGQATGFERALQAFLKDCVQRSSCALGRSVTKAQDRLNVFFRQLDATPEQVGDRKLTEALGTLGVAASLYSTDSWGTLRKALAQGLRGDGRGLLALADYYSSRNADGTYADNSLDSFYAITCLDRTDAKGIDAIQALATKLTENNSSTFGAFIAWGSTPCSSWPVKATLVPEKVAAAGSRPIVVVGTTRDPATPFEWSQSLADQLAKGVLVVRDGDGHTGYRQGNSCVDEAIDRYLAKGTVPEDGLFCS